MTNRPTRMTSSATSFVRRAWRLTYPYWKSEERWRARVLLAVIVALSLGLVYISVRFNTWNREFYDALQNKDFPSFVPLLIQFTILAALYIIAAVFKLYFTQMLEMRWRVWLTGRFLGSWLDRDHRAYYRLEVRDQYAGRTDNPDQRISDDLRLFTSNTLDLTFGLLSSVVTLFSFVTILWAISGPLTFALGGEPITIPGYMLWVAVIYALAGSILTHRVGRRLIGLNFEQQRLEADFRFGLMRVRENAEGIALYHGEAQERDGLVSRFERIRANWWDIMDFTRRLTFFTVFYDQLAIIFPILVAAPRYFDGAIELGVLFQIADAFGQVQGSLSWFVGSYGSLATWKATVDRLLTFQQALAQTAARDVTDERVDGTDRLQVVPDGAEAVRIEHVDLRLPNGQSVLPDTSLEIGRGDRVLLTGPTGSGKSTLFRAVAGIWPYGRGTIQVPASARMLFLPQKPYLPLGTLRDVITYPSAPGTFTDDEIREVLHATQLESFAGRLDESQNWTLLMSGGEQQRLAVARALLQQSDWLFLDEATASVDEASERRLYDLLQQRLPNATIVSIAHHPELAAFHDRQFALAQTNGHAELTPVDSAPAAGG